MSVSLPLSAVGAGRPDAFERLGALQEELAKVESRLRAIRPGAVPKHTEEADPALPHMLSVELCQLAAVDDTVGVRILLNCGANADSRDYNERTPLHIASSKGHVQMVKLLLDFGADDKLTDKDDKTALNLAEEGGYDEVVQLLLEHADPNRMVCVCGKPVNPSTYSPLAPSHPDFSQIPQPMMGSLIVIMVGLPGRGKTYIARQIKRYFQWNGLKSNIFTHAEYRKKLISDECITGYEITPEQECCISAAIAHDITQFVAEDDSVAILDGTNCTSTRRMALMSSINNTGLIRPSRVVFVEVINNDTTKVLQNVIHVKEMFPDAKEDFIEKYYERIERQERIYKTLNPDTDNDITYIRIEDQITYSLNNISGWMPSRLAYMLHNLSHSPGNLYLTRAGEYVDFVSGRIGGNSQLTERGKAYSEALFEYFEKELKMNSFTVMSSCALRCTETVRHFEEQSVFQHGSGSGGPSSSSMENNSAPTATGEEEEEGKEKGEKEGEKTTTGLKLNCRVAYFPTLDDINHGDCDGQLLSDVRKTMPGTLRRMQEDPYHTAWPNGECMHQVFNARLEPHIHDIQASTQPVLVVSHLHLLQGLYSYFVSENDEFVAPQNAYEIDIPFESVIKIRLVGVNRVAEVINLSKEVDRIMLQRTGKITSAPQMAGMEVFRKFFKR
ncbi:6-phosphofructo-2-kinase/fructose-2,6-biphosphatase [Trypanosoma theileri]|uniref:6-phosphofructo-2-kinase/fructose-2, 6-biphosphatase n=1 Tax=Trypanosoma theileri TaxID=67003 RepID=A0A1X0NU02_9TRYP|nr:6-phosphofructo-2-kinase/fructose-2,6-biphosphatase [Trypanosoma theileri]ORC87659.1 6-phosphofructo-2-kinase/fructose-2,6-biphosphatase [Trypanosoma theileri]